MSKLKEYVDKDCKKITDNLKEIYNIDVSWCSDEQISNNQLECQGCVESKKAYFILNKTGYDLHKVLCLICNSA